ncbi:hypothetical protein GCK32_015236 [Trichostrongylus colubriformis]|uniref:Uncharacterized protein n=1 Tax=Trichostrongylus colubriformis TaxID=6319 RepID=A0AAN8GEL1_TRICO
MYLTPDNKELMIPAASGGMETSSILSAFIVAVVMRVWDPDKSKLLSLLSKEALEYLFTVHVLKAQELAYERLPSSREWLGDETKDSLLSESSLRSAADKVRRNYRKRTQRVKKEQFDRVTSIVKWHRDRYRNTAITFTMSTLEPFGMPWSSDYVPLDNSSFPRFQDLATDTESQPFTSAADLMLVDAYSKNNKKLLMQVSASGSVRTVEAVSTVMLRILLLNEQPGEAIHRKAAFYDPRKGQFFCENEQIRVMLREKQKMLCNEMEKDDSMANDRFVIAASVRPSLREYIRIGVTQRSDDWNYPVGY